MASQNELKSYNTNDKTWSGYDLKTFSGRLQYFHEITSPDKSFNSTETIQGFQADVKAVRASADANGLAKMTQEEYMTYRYKRGVLASSTSPDSGAVIPWAMRTCSFVPTNIPIILGMLTSPPTQFFTMFWQWANQTYNAGLNYGNRNASSTQTTSELMQAYCIGSGTAIGVACTLRAMAPMLLGGRTGGIAQLANYFIGYTAVASSSSINVYAMRFKEMESGISVKAESTDEDMGLSKKAAAAGINMTMASRCSYCLPIFFVPAFWNMLLSKARLMPKNMGVTRVILETIGVTLGLYVAMPLNCALFPQQAVIAVKDLEPEIQERAKAKGLTELVYNKGL